MAEKEQLITAPKESTPAAPPAEHGALLKYGSLAFLIVQNSSHVLLLRYSRVIPGDCREYVVRVLHLLLSHCPPSRGLSAHTQHL